MRFERVHFQLLEIFGGSVEVLFALGDKHMIEVLDPEIWEERESQVKRALSKITKAIKYAYRNTICSTLFRV